MPFFDIELAGQPRIAYVEAGEKGGEKVIDRADLIELIRGSRISLCEPGLLATPAQRTEALGWAEQLRLIAAAAEAEAESVEQAVSRARKTFTS